MVGRTQALQPFLFVSVALVVAVATLLTSTTVTAELLPLRGHHNVTTVPLTSKSRLERARRSASTPTLDNLIGCPSSDFSAAVTIGTGAGAQTFDLIVDTGSSTLAVAASSCSCGGVSPTYNTALHTSNGAVNKGTSTSSQYGDGSGWSGTVYTDTVSLGGYSLPGMAIAVITSQTSFFSASCSTSAPMNQGIMGMAYESLATTGTDAFPDKWEQVNLGTAAGAGAPAAGSLIFSMVLCSTQGYMWINGMDTSYATAPPVYIPLTQDLYYDINVNGMEFTDSSGTTTYSTLATGSAAFPSAIVDSGTTQLVVTTAVFNAMNTYLNSNSAFTNLFGKNYLSSPSCNSLPSGKTIAQINAQLPWLRVDLDNSVSLVMPAISSYLQQSVSGSTTYICPGVGTSTTVILGWGVMNNYLVVFDRSTDVFSLGAVGWAPTTKCGTGTTALVLGTSSQPSSSPTNSPTKAPTKPPTSAPTSTPTKPSSSTSAPTSAPTKPSSSTSAPTSSAPTTSPTSTDPATSTQPYGGSTASPSPSHATGSSSAAGAGGGSNSTGIIVGVIVGAFALLLLLVLLFVFRHRFLRTSSAYHRGPYGSKQSFSSSQSLAMEPRHESPSSIEAGTGPQSPTPAHPRRIPPPVPATSPARPPVPSSPMYSPAVVVPPGNDFDWDTSAAAPPAPLPYSSPSSAPPRPKIAPPAVPRVTPANPAPYNIPPLSTQASSASMNGSTDNLLPASSKPPKLSPKPNAGGNTGQPRNPMLPPKPRPR